MNPKSSGGKIAWGPVQDQPEDFVTGEVTCRSEGPFQVDEFYCDESSKYVWRCKTESSCNSITPLETLDKNMWESWELTALVPTKFEK